jgi:hypothetical protein
MTTDPIDYEALAKAAYYGDFDPIHAADWVDAGEPTWGSFDAMARAVVAALRDQGFVLVRADDVGVALAWLIGHEESGNRIYSNDERVAERLREARRG